MPRAGAELRFDNLDGGLNVHDHPADLRQSESPYLMDYRHDGNALRKRPGDTPLSTSTFGGVQAVRMFLTDGNRLWILLSNGTLYTSVAAGAPTSVGAAGVGGDACLIKAVVNGGQGPYYVSSHTGMAQTTAVGPPAAWTAASGTLPTNPSVMIYAQARVIVASPTVYPGVNDVKSTVVASIAGNPRGWDTTLGAWAVELDPNDGEEIVALIQFGPNVIAFKETKAYVIYDLDTGANRLLESAGGMLTSGRRMACRTPQGIIYVHRDGRLMMTDGSSVKELSAKVQPFVSSWGAGGVDSSCFFDGAYWLQQNNYVHEFRLEEKTWWRHRIQDGFAIATVRDVNNLNEKIVLLEGIAGNVGVNSPRLSHFMGGNQASLESYSNGGFITPIWRSKLVDAGSTDRKRVTQLTIDGQGGASNSVAVKAYSDVLLDPIGPQFEGPVWLPNTQLGAGFSALAIPTITPSVGGAPSRRLLFEVQGATYFTAFTARVTGRQR